MLFSSRACSNRRSILEPGRGGRRGSGDGSTGGSTGRSTSANSGGGGGGDVPSARGARRSDAVPTDSRPARAPPEPPARPALRPASQGRSPRGLPRTGRPLLSLATPRTPAVERRERGQESSVAQLLSRAAAPGLGGPPVLLNVSSRLGRERVRSTLANSSAVVGFLPHSCIFFFFTRESR